MGRIKIPGLPRSGSGVWFLQKSPFSGATQLILLGALNPSPERVAGIFLGTQRAGYGWDTKKPVI
jgi:hypothetical protein